MDPVEQHNEHTGPDHHPMFQVIHISAATKLARAKDKSY